MLKTMTLPRVVARLVLLLSFTALIVLSGCAEAEDEADFLCTGPEDCLGGLWCVITNYDKAESECRQIESRLCSINTDCSSCRNTDPSGDWQCVETRCINLNRTALNYAVLEVHEDCPAEELD